MPVGNPFMFRERSTSSKALAKIFGAQHKALGKMVKKGRAFYEFPETIKQNFDYGGEILLGHFALWYIGRIWFQYLPSLFSKSNWPSKNLMISWKFQSYQCGGIE